MILAQISDLHLRPMGVPCYRVSETATFADRAVEALLAFRPAIDAVLISGDLTEAGLDAEYALLNDILAPLEMPVYAIPGNHDLREPMRRAFADCDWMPASGPIQFSVSFDGVRLVALDSLVEGRPHGKLCPAGLEFLSETLAADPEIPTIIAVHHPPITCGMTHMDSINLVNADALEAITREYDNIERIVCGHHHRSITKRFGRTIVQVVPSVAHQVVLTLGASERALFNFEPATFHIHCWNENEGLASHQAYIERYPGPYSFWADPDYPFPGKTPAGS